MGKETRSLYWLAALFLLLPSLVFATSGACSDHGGVDCFSGSNANVICKDGWDESTVSYGSMIECQSPTSAGGLFAMKQRCASYSRIIQNEILDLNVSSQTNAKIHPGAEMTVILDEIFYSPVSNSCLYTQTIYIKTPSMTIGNRVMPASDGVTYSINDYLDNESQIYAVVVDKSDLNSAKITEFYDKVDYYKGNTPEPVTPAAGAPQGSALKGFVIGTPVSQKSSLVAGIKPAVTASTSVSSSFDWGVSAAKAIVPATSTASSLQPKNVNLFGHIYKFFTSFFRFF